MRQVLLHGHIFKNAGSTLDWSLQRSFGTAFLAHQDESLLRSQGLARLEHLLVQDAGLMALSSHHMPRVPARLGNTHFHRLHLLRAPLSRALSVYAFERRQQAQTPGALAAKRMGLEQYLCWRMQSDVANVVRNYQTAYLAGCHRPLIRAEENSTLFDAARQVLEGLPQIGLVERFDHSMVIFETALKAHFPALDLSYQAQNVSPDRQNAAMDTTDQQCFEALMGGAASSVVTANEYDLELYRLAESKLDQAVANCAGFDDKLREFRNRCNVLQDQA